MPAKVFVAPIENGICVQIVGKGSMHESAVVRDVIAKVLATDPETRAVIDLTRCDYLDSTLLGCLIGIHRHAAGRFSVVATDEVVAKILAPTRLNQLLAIIPEAPPLTGDALPLDIPPTRLSDMTEHLYDCHARLAEIDGPLQPVFAKIAAQMKRDLQTQKQ